VVGDKQHLKYLWGGVKTNKAKKKQIEESIGERLFRLRSCLPNRATEHNLIGATTKERLNSLKIRKSLII
jgi:hypothetical protein